MTPGPPSVRVPTMSDNETITVATNRDTDASYVVLRRGFQDSDYVWHVDADNWDYDSPKYQPGDTILYTTGNYEHTSIVGSIEIKYDKPVYRYVRDDGEAAGYDYVETVDNSAQHTLVEVPTYSVNDIIKWELGRSFYQVAEVGEEYYSIKDLESGVVYMERISHADENTSLAAEAVQ